jgi:DNA-binding MarR family transcriptional regulator
MATNWLTATEMVAWRTYIETYGDLIAAIERDLAEHDLTLGDYQVFVYLAEAPDRSMRMCDLAERLQLSPSGLTRRLDGLVKAGFVTREPSVDDRRVMLATLTSNGFAALEAAAPDHVASVRRHIFDRLDDDQVDSLATIFQAIKSGLAR